MADIQVAVVDDSALMRQCLSTLLNDVAGIHVYLVAPDPIVAHSKFAKHWPDVIILDLEMPRMDGLSYLQQIMRERPTPVIILSSQARQGARKTVQALEAGAFEVFCKPDTGLKEFLQQQLPDLVNAIKAAGKQRQQVRLTQAKNLPESTEPLPDIQKVAYGLIALGSSTGGTLALEQILQRLTPPLPPIVMVQHMPPNFTQALAERLDSLSALEVIEVTHPQKLKPNCAYLAPGDRHLAVVNHGGILQVNLLNHAPVNRHRPSVDVLFDSISQCVKVPVLAALLTGMGQDGAQGLLHLAQQGHMTIAQDESSCVVFGMPKAAIDLGAAKQVLKLLDITRVIQGVGRV